MRVEAFADFIRLASPGCLTPQEREQMQRIDAMFMRRHFEQRDRILGLKPPPGLEPTLPSEREH